jgi:DNA-binding XRE family transcriptional regulator
MKDTKMKHQFVELRAHDKSQRTVADELGIGLQTAVRWESELKEQIENHKAIELEALLERHRLTLKAQIERYDVELARVNEEIQKRDLSDVPTPKLYDVMIKLDTRVDQSRPALTLHDDDEIADQKELRELIASRRARKASELNAHAGRQGSGNGTVSAEDLVTLQLTTLQRFRAGKIDGRTAANEMAMIGSIFKGIDIADLQTCLERIETMLENDSA